MSEQSLRALDEANRVRLENARALRELAALGGMARFAAAAMLRRPMKREGAIHAVTLLMHIPRVGRVRATRLCRAVGVPTTARLRGLTDRQRNALADVLSGDEPIGVTGAVRSGSREADAIRELRRQRPDVRAPEQVVAIITRVLQRQEAA